MTFFRLLIIISIISTTPVCIIAADTGLKLVEAEGLMSAKDFQGAYKILGELHKQDPKNLNINYGLGMASFEIRDYERAFMALEYVITMSPSDTRAKDLALQWQDRLNHMFTQDPADVNINFYLGRAAFINRDFESAIMAFERVLIARPDAYRAKLEMARSYFLMGSYAAAHQYFKEVLENGPPENVRLNIEGFISAIKSTEKRHFLSGSISTGCDWDDNVNVAPSSAEIEIRNDIGQSIPVTIDDAKRDEIFTSMANFSYVYKDPDGLSAWKVSCVNYNALYNDEEDLDINYFSFKAGLSVQGRAISWDVYALLDHLNLDYDQYMRTHGTGTSLLLGISQGLVLSMDAKFRKKNYYETPDKDAKNISLSLNPVYVLGFNRLSASLAGEMEDAQEDVNTYKRGSFGLGYGRQLPYLTTLSLNYTYQCTDYDDENPLFGKRRSDDVQYFSAGLTKTLWQTQKKDMGLNLGVNYTYTTSRSNIDLYTYTKNVISSSLSFVF